MQNTATEVNCTTCKKKFAGASSNEIGYIVIEMLSEAPHLHVKHLPKHVQTVSFMGVPCLTVNDDDGEAFRGLTALKELLLENCAIERVNTAAWFRDLRSLTQLDLSSNKLTSLDSPTTTPVHLPNLHFFNVSANAIARVDAGFLACMSNNLTHLVMHHNALTCLESDTLAAAHATSSARRVTQPNGTNPRVCLFASRQTRSAVLEQQRAHVSRAGRVRRPREAAAP